MKIEIAYATKEKQKIYTLEVATGTTVLTAIELSNVLKDFPEINLQQQKVGIFSKICKLNDVVKEGDRIEIYRPLLIAPMEARRLRAIKQPIKKR